MYIPSIIIKDHGRPPGLTLKHLIYVKRKHAYIKSTRHLKLQQIMIVFLNVEKY